MPLSRRDRRIADINIRLCLPGLTAEERDDLVRGHFESLGCALLETGLVWWASPQRLKRWSTSRASSTCATRLRKAVAR